MDTKRKSLIVLIAALVVIIIFCLVFINKPQETAVNVTSAPVQQAQLQNNLPPKIDTLQVVDKIKDFNYKFEAGLNYEQYNVEYQNLYVGIRRYNDKYPNSPLAKDFLKLAVCYKDLQSVWENKIYKYSLREDQEPMFTLLKRYPEMNNLKSFKSGVVELKDGKWVKPDARHYAYDTPLQFLIEESSDQSANIIKHYTEAYGQ